MGNPHSYTIANPNTYDSDTIDVDYIATIIAPEMGPARSPGLGASTAMAHAKRLYPFFTDNDGNGFMYFFPYAVAAPYGARRKHQTLDNYVYTVNNAYCIFNGPDQGSFDYAGAAAYDPNNGSFAYKVATLA